MSNTVEPGLAKSTGFISIAAGICGLGNCICGFIWLGYNGYGGHGLWSGFGVSLFSFLLLNARKTLVLHSLIIIRHIVQGFNCVLRATLALGYKKSTGEYLMTCRDTRAEPYQFPPFHGKPSHSD